VLEKILLASSRRDAAAINSNSPRRLIYHCTDKVRHIFFFCCTSAESFFSCCNSVAALAFANCNEHMAEANITAPAHAKRSLHGAACSPPPGCFFA
jgi:hypothetical protein